MPPTTYPVDRSAADGSAMDAFFPPSAVASAFRSSDPLTGTTAHTNRPSRSASSVLNIRAGSTPRAIAPASPYDETWVSGSYGCSVCGTPSRESSSVAGVPFPATDVREHLVHGVGHLHRP